MRNGGLVRAHDWKREELEKLITTYADKNKPVALTRLAQVLGRNKANVCRKARELGLTNLKRAKVLQRKNAKIYSTIEELRAAQSRNAKARIEKYGHPRGSLGMRHSEKTKLLLAKKSRDMWSDPLSKLNSPEMAQMRSDLMVKRIASGQMRCGYSRTRGGKRSDLGDVYFRSAWEANYARYLNFLVDRGELRGWMFEPKTFVFEAIKRGVRAYTPDFRVERNDGAIEWHEVKGWMDSKSKTRISRFKKYFPNEVLIIIDGKWFKSANRSIAPLIIGWEGGTVHV